MSSEVRNTRLVISSLYAIGVNRYYSEPLCIVRSSNLRLQELISGASLQCSRSRRNNVPETLKTRTTRSIMAAVVVLAFCAGHALAACNYSSATCTYSVMGCYVTAVCNEQLAIYCYTEFGFCCGGDTGRPSSTFCSTGCDGSGGGPC